MGTYVRTPSLPFLNLEIGLFDVTPTYMWTPQCMRGTLETTSDCPLPVTHAHNILMEVEQKRTYHMRYNGFSFQPCQVVIHP